MASPKPTSALTHSPVRVGLTRRPVPGQRTPIQLQPAHMAAALQRALRPQATLSAADLRALQQVGGNQAVQRLLAQRGQARLPLVQAKLTVGAAGDTYEREADRIAALIAGRSGAPTRAGHSPAGSAIRRQPAYGGPIGAEGAEVPGNLERLVSTSGGRPMPEKVRGVLETRLGLDLSPVRVHTDANAVQLNREFGAQAFTHQNHIFYGPGQSPDDLALTAHETVHTIQQGAVGPSRVNRQAGALPEGEQPVPVEAAPGAALQRKFGLEVELGIFMNSGAGVKNDTTGAVQYDRPKVKKHPVVAQNAAKSLELHEETGSSGTPKVELVSNPPYDEFKEPEETVKAKLGAMRDFARRAESKSNGFKDRIPLNTVMPEAGAENFLGSESPSAAIVQNIKGNLQATYGVRLDRVKALFELQSQPAQEQSATTAPAPDTASPSGPPPPPGPPPPMLAKKDKADDSAKYLKQAMEQTERLVAALQLEALQPDDRDIVGNWVAHTNRTSWLGKDKKRSAGLENLDGLVAQLGNARINYDRDTLTRALNGVQTALSAWRRSKATWYGAARDSMRESEARELETEADRIHDLLNDLLTGPKTAELEGFLALICNYLLAGKEAKGIGWGKNKVGQLFYKTRLSSVRQNLTGAIDSTIKDRQPRVQKLILKETGRSGSEGVLSGGPVKVKAWLGEILAGTGDPMFEALKNEYADEIAPKDEWLTESGGTVKGVVAENRQLAQLMKVGQQPEDWVTTGVKLYRMLRMVNGLQPPVFSDIRDVLNQSS